jgi:hypothetical protein
MKHRWTLDTPWAKKGMEYTQVEYKVLYKPEPMFTFSGLTTIDELLSLGWIKPVEEKGKLTAAEILGKITFQDAHDSAVLEPRLLAAFLAEHLK